MNNMSNIINDAHKRRGSRRLNVRCGPVPPGECELFVVQESHSKGQVPVQSDPIAIREKFLESDVGSKRRSEGGKRSVANRVVRDVQFGQRVVQIGRAHV